MEETKGLPHGTLSVGLALGGGGVRGLAIVGVLRVLEEADIPIHSIAGTSIGGILGSLWAVGLRSAAIEAEVRRLTALSRMIRLVDWVPSLRGLMPGHKFYTYLDNLLGHHIRFEELEIPFAVVATDLNHWREATLTTGLVIDAVRASMSVPGVFAPVEIGDMRLVDGGFVNNVPVDVARGLGPDIVVAVDVDRQPTSADGGTPVLPIDSPLPNFTPLLVADLWLVTHIMADAVKQAKFQTAPPDVRLIPAIPSNVGILSGLGHIDEIIASGAAAATAALPQLAALMAATPAELIAIRHAEQQALSPVKIAPFMAQDAAHGTT